MAPPLTDRSLIGGVVVPVVPVRLVAQTNRQGRP